MKKKLRKYKKSRTKSEMKKTIHKDSKSNDTSFKSLENNTSKNNLAQQNNRYPSDIQGLFERLGID